MPTKRPNKKARRAVQFFERCLTHVEGEWAGQPFILPAWQRKIVETLFGTVGRDGLRQYRQCLVAIPRKNGKSTMCAGIALYMLLVDGEPGAKVFSCAADRDQARLVFQIASDMVRASPVLSRHVEIQKQALYNPATASVYRAISADAFTKHGLNASAVIFDELHAQKDRQLWDVMVTAQGARREPLLMAITTAGWDRESICWEVWNYARQVRDGLVQDDAFLPAIWESAEDADWTDPKTWRKCNPNLGKSLKQDYLERECKKAQESAAYENTFRQLHLNQWTQQAVRWLPMRRWDACAGHTAIEDGAACYAGLDLASTRDMTALVLCFRDGDDFALRGWYWCPRETAIRRSRHEQLMYEDWARTHSLELTEGDVCDYDLIATRIEELARRYDIRGIAVDPWNSRQLQQQLTEIGLNVEEYGQNYRTLSGPTKELERRVVEGTIDHGQCPILRWMASNVTVDTDAHANLKPNKSKSSEKIDGIVAAIMAIGMTLNDDESRSVYEDEPLLVLD